MKRLSLYTIGLIIVALGATSCARKEDRKQVEMDGEVFQMVDETYQYPEETPVGPEKIIIKLKKYKNHEYDHYEVIKQQRLV